MTPDMERTSTLVIAFTITVTAIGLPRQVMAQAGHDFTWSVHDMNRPQPEVVDPKGHSGAPSDAHVLFDGSDLNAWHSSGKDARWIIENGEMIVAGGGGDLRTRDSFGDCQLHLEWMIPEDREVHGQHGGNSGVFLMDRYEVQILQSHGNTTYADGMASSIYGQYPPQVNACRPPGNWNIYDIVFRRPIFTSQGSLLEPAYITVFLNGVLVQENVKILGGGTHGRRASYSAHPDRLPVRIQDHGDPIHFRNIWIRGLGPRQKAE